jgi:hypothetical protein
MILRTSFYGAFSPPCDLSRNRVLFMGAVAQLNRLYRIHIILQQGKRKSRSLPEISYAYRPAKTVSLL